MTTSHDPLTQLLDLAHDLGHELCVGCLATDLREAGALTDPLRDSGDLSPLATAACELLLTETAISSPTGADLDDSTGPSLIRLRVAARLTGLLLPPALIDVYSRYAIELGPDGVLPDVTEFEPLLRAAVGRLQAYLDEHDTGGWVDPNAVAGAVADIHDAARALEALIELSRAAVEERP